MAMTTALKIEIFRERNISRKARSWHVTFEIEGMANREKDRGRMEKREVCLELVTV